MRKYISLVVIVVVSVSMLLAVGCTTTSTPTAETPTSETTTESPSPITLTAGFWMGSEGDISVSLKRLMAGIEERSDGRLKVEATWGGSLVSMYETGDAIRRGMADIGYWSSHGG